MKFSDECYPSKMDDFHMVMKVTDYYQEIFPNLNHSDIEEIVSEQFSDMSERISMLEKINQQEQDIRNLSYNLDKANNDVIILKSRMEMMENCPF